MGERGGSLRDDKMSFTLSFEDGSFGTVHYFANGSKTFPKERVEVFCAGRVLQLDNFRQLNGYGWPGFKGMSLRRQDKGHGAEMQALVDAIRQGKSSPGIRENLCLQAVMSECGSNRFFIVGSLPEL